jgi:hypothetical protein
MMHNHLTRLENMVLWRWSAGDVVIWDNRATQHKAIGAVHPRDSRWPTTRHGAASPLSGNNSRKEARSGGKRCPPAWHGSLGGSTATAAHITSRRRPHTHPAATTSEKIGC